MQLKDVLKQIKQDQWTPVFEQLYGTDSAELAYQKARYAEAVLEFSRLYPNREEIFVFSAPGRTEVGGNHTDHQHGCVLAAAVNRDMIGVVAFHEEKEIRVTSKGYPPFSVPVGSWASYKGQASSAAMVCGMAEKFEALGADIRGFDLYMTSDVLSGSGLSSSAAFEVLIGTVLNRKYLKTPVSDVEIAIIGQYAENEYFGKNSGLMDQTVCACGNFVSIDFSDTQNPKVKPLSVDFASMGYALCITDTKGSHADLTDDYDAIRHEMESVAHQFGRDYLRRVDEDAFYEALPKLRESCCDRALLRAMHFFADNRRAVDEARALENKDIEGFLSLVRQSGASSLQLLQNLYSVSAPENQPIPLALAESERFLQGKGAARVHGGGFAGTIQAFVPLSMAKGYAAHMDRLFGDGACQILRIRPVGGVELTDR